MIGVEQLLTHAIGDYVLQNHWMASRKTTAWYPAILHALFYTVPFALWFGVSWALVPICLTHALIDHYRVARWWTTFWGVGCEGWILRKLRERHQRPKGALIVDNQEPDPAPPFLAVWLLIIVDNIMHVCINAVSLAYLGAPL